MFEHVSRQALAGLQQRGVSPLALFAVQVGLEAAIQAVWIRDVYKRRKNSDRGEKENPGRIEFVRKKDDESLWTPGDERATYIINKAFLNKFRSVAFLNEESMQRFAFIRDHCIGEANQNELYRRKWIVAVDGIDGTLYYALSRKGCNIWFTVLKYGKAQCSVCITLGINMLAPVTRICLAECRRGVHVYDPSSGLWQSGLRLPATLNGLIRVGHGIPITKEATLSSLSGFLENMGTLYEVVPCAEAVMNVTVLAKIPVYVHGLLPFWDWGPAEAFVNESPGCALRLYKFGDNGTFHVLDARPPLDSMSPTEKFGLIVGHTHLVDRIARFLKSRRMHAPSSKAASMR